MLLSTPTLAVPVSTICQELRREREEYSRKRPVHVPTGRFPAQTASACHSPFVDRDLVGQQILSAHTIKVISYSILRRSQRTHRI
jgi:hypothetical protein